MLGVLRVEGEVETLGWLFLEGAQRGCDDLQQQLVVLAVHADAQKVEVHVHGPSVAREL
ncbi:hypothetical protein QF030_001208 [Streptomyces rishiriensis]|uniref:Uncharacterized protein n=1 Tax=Streptomyces rishiriensis TaxID=68264 RepID=A0ABU0NIW5_STRRH|nr:hypothetical protein [Streptomyces rishiriensis]